jgi:CubicO group peptidase (beta-lactamase class C family)
MLRLARITTVLLALLMTAGSAAIISKDLPVTKPEDVGLSSERLGRMTKAIHAYVDEGRTPGVITLIARHGKVVHLDAYGKADLATGRPTRTDDIFRMYSMTKPITSVALLMLFEEGKFQLTDPLSRYFPGVGDMKVYAAAHRKAACCSTRPSGQSPSRTCSVTRPDSATASAARPWTRCTRTPTCLRLTSRA